MPILPMSDDSGDECLPQSLYDSSDDEPLPCNVPSDDDSSARLDKHASKKAVETHRVDTANELLPCQCCRKNCVQGFDAGI